MDNAAIKTDPYGMRLFEGCDGQKVRGFLAARAPMYLDTVVYMKIRPIDNTSTGGINSRDILTLPDSVIAPLPPRWYLEIPYQIKRVPEALNGGRVGIYTAMPGPDGTDHNMSLPDYVNVYNKYSYNLEYSPRTTLHKE